MATATIPGAILPLTRFPPLPPPLERLVPGYPRLAGKIELQPEFGIFRRFGALNARDLLYRQAQLIQLENKIIDVEKVDKESNAGNRNRYSADWYWLDKSPSSIDVAEKEQKRLLDITSPFLKEYSM
jgi:hypothetical protein